jgi:hypothetical protein
MCYTVGMELIALVLVFLLPCYLILLFLTNMEMRFEDWQKRR